MFREHTFEEWDEIVKGTSLEGLSVSSVRSPGGNLLEVTSNHFFNIKDEIHRSKFYEILNYMRWFESVTDTEPKDAWKKKIEDQLKDLQAQIIQLDIKGLVKEDL